ncbi:hypothetical protein AGR6A_Lc120117 [Agrobacterium sp. NCPPB 925]|nr:hypothetical protein AGR6A_Lc120117 [Agrobacterium sp. NCPPB 925]
MTAVAASRNVGFPTQYSPRSGTIILFVC